MGHDPDIVLPHVPGHEFAGIIRELGKGVRNWKVGDRVTVPFVCACGTCTTCQTGNQQICDDQFQPGFTHWGSFAQYVAVHRAETNLVKLPDSVSFEAAASLGCRFATSFRAVVAQGKVSGGQLVAVHGCGGVGLSAIMIAAAQGAVVIAVDIDAAKVDRMRNGEIPIYEPHLDVLFERNIKAERLSFTTNLAEGIASAEIIFLALPTPPGADGAADLSFVLGVAEEHEAPHGVGGVCLGG